MKTTSPADIVSEVHARHYLSIVDRLHKTLCEAQALRSEKSNWVEGDGGTTLEWILYERQVMFKAVNWERACQNLKPITVEQLRRAENCAVGHCDYTRKFALYCAELVTDGEVRVCE
jgi:hypothetical protein